MGRPLTTDPYKCPKCNSTLVLKEGRYGRFMACPNYPDCQYTRALWTFTKPHCEKCNGTQLLPFVRDGKIIPQAFIHCDCYEEHEFYYPLKPDDFDFPCSYTFRSYYTQEFDGVILPDLEPENNTDFERRMSLLEAKSPDLRRGELEQLKGRMNFLENKIMEMRAKKKERGKVVISD